MELYTMAQTKPCIRLPNKSTTRFHLWSGDNRVASYLILLLEAVALGALHLGDVLEEVSHTDGWVQLTCLVGHIKWLSLPQGVSVRLHQAAGVTAHVLALIYRGGGTQTGTSQSTSGQARK